MIIDNAVANYAAHGLPADLKKAFVSNPKALASWEDITPLARNEWTCWVITVKQLEARKNHIARTITDWVEGKRRPCCWIGFIHRKNKPISQPAQWVIDEQSKPK